MFKPRHLLGLAAGLSLLAASATSNAIVLTFGDANYLGLINDGIPSSPASEAGYINDLTTLAAGDLDTVIGTETYNRESSTLAGPFTTVVIADAVKDESGSDTIVVADLYQYVLGKYDASRAGSLVWYFASGVSGTIELPSSFNGHGISHISLYNKTDGGGTPPSVVPEPLTVAMLGVGLVAMGFSRRRQPR